MIDRATAKHILVIDHEPATRVLICEYLKMDGLRADAPGSIGETLSLLRAKDYDLVTLDLHTPWIDRGGAQGFILAPSGHAPHMRNVLPQGLPPVLIITAFAQEPWVADLLDGENVVGILAKPLSHELFSVTVRRILLQLEARKRTPAKVREGPRRRFSGRATPERAPTTAFDRGLVGAARHS